MAPILTPQPELTTDAVASDAASALEQQMRLQLLRAALKNAGVQQGSQDQVVDQQAKTLLLKGRVTNVLTLPDSVTVHVLRDINTGQSIGIPEAYLEFPPNDSKVFLSELIRAQNQQLKVHIAVDMSGSPWKLTALTVY